MKQPFYENKKRMKQKKNYIIYKPKLNLVYFCYQPLKHDVFVCVYEKKKTKTKKINKNCINTIWQTYFILNP